MCKLNLEFCTQVCRWKHRAPSGSPPADSSSQVRGFVHPEKLMCSVQRALLNAHLQTHNRPEGSTLSNPKVYPSKDFLPLSVFVPPLLLHPCFFEELRVSGKSRGLSTLSSPSSGPNLSPWRHTCTLTCRPTQLLFVVMCAASLQPHTRL